MGHQYTNMNEDIDLLTEVFDTNFTIHRNQAGEDQINKKYRGTEIATIHTKIMASQEMIDAGVSVVRLRNVNRGQFEYHIHNRNSKAGVESEIPRKALLHTLKIIHDHATEDLKSGAPVMFQTTNDEQCESYTKMANRLATKVGKVVTHVGEQPLTDGSRKAKAMIIEWYMPPGHTDFFGTPYKTTEERFALGKKYLINVNIYE